ncbi:MAG TPA: phosphatase PAP2 family protein [Chthoniobacterales bacterium]|nr:phosphatase PAP2 family protein [Chthoniobacterales bacterium]
MKDKREFRTRRGLRWWWALFAGAVILIPASLCFDANAQAWIVQHQSSGARSFMQAVSKYGDWPEHVALGLVLLGIAYWRGSKRWTRIFAAMLIACALAGVSARVVKIATGRSRPNVQTEAGWNGPRLSARYNAFPSGHTAASTAFFATLAFASWRIGAGFLVIPLLIAFSRMYVAAHHLSDVVGAALIGLGVAYFIAQRLSISPPSQSSALQ